MKCLSTMPAVVLLVAGSLSMSGAFGAQANGKGINPSHRLIRNSSKSFKAPTAISQQSGTGNLNRTGGLTPGANSENLVDGTRRSSDLELGEAKIFGEESIVIGKPQLKALISITDGLNPLELDAEGAQSISLRDALLSSLNNNLDIGISRTGEASQRWDYVGSLSKFLPDALLSYNYQYLRGRINVPIQNVPTLLRFNTPFIITSAGFRVWGYQGGKILFGALESRHSYRAASASRRATIGDTLLETAKRYYNLVLEEALLQIRIKAVQTSQAQFGQNSDLHQDGLATRLEVLQSKTQLSKDRQGLIDQQIARRNASVQLAHLLNASMAIDLSPTGSEVRKVRLVSRTFKIGALLSQAIDHRPELKQYEELRLAAKRAIVVASAPLQPRVQFLGNVYGIGETLGRDKFDVPTVFQPVAVAGAPVTAPVLGPIPTAAFAGNPGLAAGTLFPVGASAVPAHSLSRQLAALYTLSLRVNWDFNNLGMSDAANIQAARFSARQAHLKANKVLLDVYEQVRSAYLNSLSSEKKIDEATDEVASAREALRLAQLRFQNGLGTNIDIIQTQRDYTAALIDKAQSIINFNIAQAQLLHDIGLISVDTLTSGHPLAP